MNTFDPKKVSVIADGTYITGFMDGTMVSAEKNEDDGTMHVGAQGDTTFSWSADDTATVTLTLKQNSPSLKHFINLSKNKKVFAFHVMDANTNGLKVGGNECVVLRRPNIEWSAEVSGVEVQIAVADYNIN